MARLTIEPEDLFDFGAIADAVERSDADVIVLRYPNREAQLFRQLMTLPNYEPLFADCLLHWETALPTVEKLGEMSPELGVGTAASGEVGVLVRSVFDRYVNHYAANSLLDPIAALEGYVEWVTTLVEDGHAICLVLEDPVGRRAGFAVIDFTARPPDIRLAGMSPEHRGRGYYRDLIVASMNLTVGFGHDRIAISTQAHNLTVMATWARLGWVPVKSMTTVHLVRRGLISHSTPESARV